MLADSGWIYFSISERRIGYLYCVSMLGLESGRTVEWILGIRELVYVMWAEIASFSHGLLEMTIGYTLCGDFVF